MGCIASKAAENEDDPFLQNKRANDIIEENLHREKNKNKNEIKLLLLGAGESGKSTVLKQLKLLHDGGFTHQERMQYGQVIWADAIESMKRLIIQARKFGIALDCDDANLHPELAHCKDIILRSNTLEQIDARMAGGSEFLNEYVLKYTSRKDPNRTQLHRSIAMSQHQNSSQNFDDKEFLLENMDIDTDNPLDEKLVLSAENPIDQINNEQIAEAISKLWTTDNGIKNCFKRSSEFQLEGSAAYYFDNIQNFARLDYICTDNDILKGRVKTTGITENTFRIGSTNFKVYDAGGQRSERRKWIQCFEGITAVLFVLAVSEFDQMLFEDERVNRMHESIMLFDTLINSRWFINTPFILFLNKVDIFEDKVKRSPIRQYFPDYPGKLGDYEAGLKYFENIFLSLNRTNKPIYVHHTCATDTSSMRFVLSAVTDLIVQQNLKKSGII